jgi:hypothetical protein
MPNLFHIVPIRDNTMLDGVSEGEDSSLGLGFISNIRVLLSHTDHDTLMSWASNDGRENGSWGIIPSKSGLAHTGAIVNDQSSNFVVTHFDWVGF